MPGPPFRRGDPVDLHTIAAAGLPFLQRNYNDPAVRRWLPAVHPTNGHAIEGYFEDWPDDVTRLLGCVDGNPVGTIAMFAVEEDAGRAMLGAWLDPDHQGVGDGRAMTARMVDYAFAERRLHRLTANAPGLDGRRGVLTGRTAVAL